MNDPPVPNHCTARLENGQMPNDSLKPTRGLQMAEKCASQPGEKMQAGMMGSEVALVQSVQFTFVCQNMAKK